MKSRGVVLATIVVLCATWCAGQAQPAAPQSAPQNLENSTPVITKETRLVLVDSVVTDKQGNYIKDLTQKDFKVWEDNKEQTIKSFSFESGAAAPSENQKRYLVMFFDNSTMNLSDQGQARAAALKFLDSNTGANRFIAIADFGGTLHITQNFTSDADRLKAQVKNLKFSAVAPNADVQDAGPLPGPSSMAGPMLMNSSANFGVRSLLMSLRDLAKGMSSVPGRKTLVLFTAGFPMNPTDPDAEQRQAELTAAIDACNKANVAIYPIDVRGLVTPVSEAPQWRIVPDSSEGRLVSATLTLSGDSADLPARLVYVQRSGGGGGGHGGGVGGGHPGGSTGTTGTRGSPGGTRGNTSAGTAMPNAPFSQSRTLIPAVGGANDMQTVLYELAAGTGGFVIVNTNDLLGGLQKIAQEQTQYYVLGYTPPESEEGTCHVLRVKVDRGDTKVRSRSGYCNVRTGDLLAGQPVEKKLETAASASQPGNVAATMLAPYFYTSPNTARVNLAIEMPSSVLKFSKEKGKEHAQVNVLGLAYKPDGTVGARFSDQVDLNFDDKDQLEAFLKKPYHYENQFEIGAGKYDLKVVFSSGGDTLGKLEMPLTVYDYDGKQFSISAIALSKELRPLQQAGNSLDAALLQDRTPLVTQGLQIVPSGNDHFKKSDVGLFYAEIYDPLLTTATPPKVIVQMVVMDRKTRQKKFETGGPVADAKPGTPVAPVGLRLPFDQLPPGSYELEVRAGDSTGRYTPVRTANFELE